jgi:protein TonB
VALLLAGAPVTSRALAKHVKAPTRSHDTRWGAAKKVGNGVSAPVAIFQPEPSFPKGVSPTKETQGVVCRIGIIVDREGKPEDVHVIQSGGRAFDAKAIAAVKEYRFKPAMQDGKPVAVRVVVYVLFKRY